MEKGFSAGRCKHLHIDQIQHDIASNLPPLVETADGAPGSVGRSLPLAKHLGALYDVLLRKEVEAARVSAPDDQVARIARRADEAGERAKGAEHDRMQGSGMRWRSRWWTCAARSASKASRPVVAPAPMSVPCTPPVVHHDGEEEAGGDDNAGDRDECWHEAGNAGAE